MAHAANGGPKRDWLDGPGGPLADRPCVSDQGKVALEYVCRCRRAGDLRPVVELLKDLVQPDLAEALAAELEPVWTD